MRNGSAVYPAISYGTRAALARKPRCNCPVCFCKRYSLGFGPNPDLCRDCKDGYHIKKLKNTPEGKHWAEVVRAAERDLASSN